MHIFVAVYFLGFLAYASLLGSLAFYLFNASIYFLAFFGLVLLVLYSMHYLQTGRDFGYPALLYEEEPESLVSLFARGE